ncbi:PAS domain-containing protein [Haloarcula regularis]|uniref:PAS domain-containing protein n=1 Tax=Haloarcula regularis TaxID=3033392 RepID=UPI0023E8EE5B|nr:PAS domain-containing protein [Halomicroarcula sp. SYNS111]
MTSSDRNTTTGTGARSGGDGSEIPVEERPLERLLESGKPVYEYEHVISRPRYDDMWVSVNMAPIWDESAHLKHVVVVIEDVTVRHAQARELERQVDLFRKAQAIASVGAWEYEVPDDQLYWTDEVYNIHGLSTDVALPVEKALEVFHPEDQPVIKDAFYRAIEAGEPYDLELRLVRDDGEQRWVNTRGEPQFVDGDVVRLRGTIQDVTDRREREEQLQRMRNAVDNAPIGITLTDPSQEDNPLIYVNEGFVEITGYTREEALGRNCRFLQGPDTGEDTVARLRRKIDADDPVTETIRNYRADGSAYWNQLQIAPVRDDEGTVVNHIGFQQDVTESVERQRQLEILDRYLRHNIRNKMTVVNGLAESIQEEGQPPVTDYANAIEQAGEALVKNLEKERRVTTLLGTEQAPMRIDTSELVQSVVTTCTHRYPDATITHSGPDSVAIEALPELSLAFEELVANAVEHSDRPSPTVEIAVEPTGDTVCIHVVDDGPGVPADEVDVLSNPDTETTVHHGRGMGLWLVQLIVNRSGGTLEFSQRDSGDNVVTIEVPRAKESGEVE